MKSIRITQSIYERLIAREIIFERPHGFQLPLNSCFEGPCNLKRVASEAKLAVGAFSYCVSGYLFGVNIARYCSFGEGVQIGRHSHPLNFGSTSPVFYNQQSAVFGDKIMSDCLHDSFNYSTKPTQFQETFIGNDVYIGHEALIMPGVKIGNGAVIGAKSVVTKDVPDYAVVAGCPAIVRRYRFSDAIIEQLLKSRWWEYSPKQLSKVSSDKPESFVDEVRLLRDAHVKGYAPDKVSLSDLQ